MVSPSACKGWLSFFRMPYNKPYKSIDEQVALLENRGMLIDDYERAKNYLSRIGYYRLSAYWYLYRKPLSDRKRGDDFISVASFQSVLDLYIFDRKLRLLALDAIERIKIACRTAIALVIGKRGSNAHLVASNLDKRFTTKINSRSGVSDYETWKQNLDKKFSTSKEDFANHFKDKYPNENPPIWIACELWDFGLLSYFLNGMQYGDRLEVARMFGVNDPKVFCSWIRTLNFVRNLSAHHCRLWNHILIDQPMMPQMNEMPEINHLLGHSKAQERFYSAAVITRYLLLHVSPDSEWKTNFIQLVLDFPENETFKLSDAGFVTSWQQEALWK